jgi:septum formation protein
LSAQRPLVLGSASPRRRELLASLGIPLVLRPADVDESTSSGESPEHYLERIVERKRVAVLGLLREAAAGAVLVADTSVVLGGEILGKPANVADAARMLGRLCGREHRVLTRYALSFAGGQIVAAKTVTSRVWLRRATEREIDGYARTGEGLDKAGSYAVQGIGSFLVERIDGSYSNVVGLPLCEVVLDLRDAGLLEQFP